MFSCLPLLWKRRHDRRKLYDRDYDSTIDKFEEASFGNLSFSGALRRTAAIGLQLTKEKSSPLKKVYSASSVSMASEEEVANPKWRQLLGESIAKNMKENKDSISYCLATQASSHPHVPSISVSVPEARFVVHRGFVNERRSPPDGSNNEEGPTSCVMLSTTDVRAPKSGQLSGKGNEAWAEVCWWFEPTGEQYRILAKTHILPPPGDKYADLLKHFPGDRLAPPSLGSSFKWEDERQRIFRKMSPPLKASFCRPVPGSKLGDEDPKKWPEELPDPDEAKGKDKEHIKEALENFAVIALEPVFVDLVRLKVQPNDRRQWTKKEDGSWEEVDVVP